MIQEGPYPLHSLDETSRNRGSDALLLYQVLLPLGEVGYQYVPYIDYEGEEVQSRGEVGGVVLVGGGPLGMVLECWAHDI